MNRDRRRVLYTAVEMIKELKDLDDKKAAAEKLKSAMELVEEARDDEQYAFDSLPEGIQMSTRGEDMEDNISDLEDAICDLEVIESTIEEMGTYDYQLIRSDILSALRNINNATFR